MAENAEKKNISKLDFNINDAITVWKRQIKSLKILQKLAKHMQKKLEIIWAKPLTVEV